MTHTPGQSRDEYARLMFEAVRKERDRLQAELDGERASHRITKLLLNYFSPHSGLVSLPESLTPPRPRKPGTPGASDGAGDFSE